MSINQLEATSLTQKSRIYVPSISFFYECLILY